MHFHPNSPARARHWAISSRDWATCRSPISRYAGSAAIERIQIQQPVFRFSPKRGQPRSIARFARRFSSPGRITELRMARRGKGGLVRHGLGQVAVVGQIVVLGHVGSIGAKARSDTRSEPAEKWIRTEGCLPAVTMPWRIACGACDGTVSAAGGKNGVAFIASASARLLRGSNCRIHQTPCATSSICDGGIRRSTPHQHRPAPAPWLLPE